MKTTNNNSDQTTNKQQLPTNNYNYKVYKTWLPDFPGFYETSYSFNDSDLENTLFNEPYKIQKEIKEFIKENIFDNINYEQYQQDISKKFTDIWFSVFQENFPNIVKSYKYEKLVSPKEYNFSTDSIDIEIELDLEKLVAEFKKDYKSASQYIHDKYTSCSGFISYYENDIEDWLQTLEQDQDHKIGAMLQYLSQNSDIDEFDSENMLYAVLDDFYNNEYINYDKLVELINDEFNINIKTLSDLENIDHIQIKDEIIWQAFATGKPDLFSDEMRFYWGADTSYETQYIKQDTYKSLFA